MRVGIEKLSTVNAIMRHEEVYPHIIDDYSLPQGGLSFEDVLRNLHIYTLMPNKGSVFIFTPHSVILYEVHCAVLPEGRGRTAVEASIKARDWMFKNTECLKIVASIPECNIRALAAARCFGMKNGGRITNAFLKNGRLVDLILFSVGKGELICLQQQP